jgi:phosphoglycerol transferase MdoB-like AlkP superfamily enzyme
MRDRCESSTPTRFLNLNSFAQNRMAGLAWLLLPVPVTGLLLRLALLLRTWGDLPHGWSLAGALLLGVFTDLVYAAYFLAPFAVYLLLVPQPIFRSSLHRFVMVIAIAFEFWLLLFTTASEWIFWDEFGVRFNFIAVDYLVYTQEVIDNILESYPVGPLLLGFAIAALAGALLYTALPWFDRWQSTATPLPARMRAGIPLLLIPVVATLLIDNRGLPEFGNRYVEEISHNGAYSFFAAFRNNELEYHDFYLDEPDSVARRQIRDLIALPDEEFAVASATPELRHVPGGTERYYNVVQIVVESLSAEFLGTYGNRDGLTPNLDRLANDSLVFTNLMATGTRTVRGMESLTLSVPPTPGRSIVKRPTNDVLQSTGSVFLSKGYRPAFFYGGYGYFDNMNDFFARNGFEIHDRGTEPDEATVFSNAWGVSDEDLYRWVLADADQQFAEGQPFFDFVMTTSNHRPYTYPAGRIDIPSASGRAGAVKYTDYALGRFFAAAKEKPWFDETIFVVVADHCAASAGKTSLPVERYRIPLMIYAPGIVEAGKVEALTSQIDVAPTLFALLGWSYDSEFFGRDMLRADASDGRALIGTYQNIGLLLADNRLTVLEPGKLVEAYQFDPMDFTQERSDVSNAALAETITYYQRASDLYTARAGRAVP